MPHPTRPSTILKILDAKYVTKTLILVRVDDLVGKNRQISTVELPGKWRWELIPLYEQDLYSQGGLIPYKNCYGW